jgi:heat shock protein HslJ
MNGMPVITPEGSKEVHFVLSSEGSEKRIKGFAGCNGLGGNYTLNGDKIKFTTMTTKMACDRLDVENFLTKSLESADSYKIKGEKLELYEGNTLLATFESVYLK